MSEARPPPTWRTRVRGALVLYVVYSVVFGVGLTVRNSWRARVPVETTPGDLAARAREVRFLAGDGLALEGVLAPPEAGRPVLLFQHGVGANRDDMVPWAKVFAAAGYGVLAFDWRAHGRSEGRLIGFGATEAADVAGALAFLARDPSTRGRPVGIVAQSMGAGIVAQAAAVLGPEVRCLVLDSPFGDLGRMARNRMRFLGPLGVLPARVVGGTAWALLGATPDSVRPEEALRAFAPRPILVMHGTADEVIPVGEGRALLAAYPGPKRSWIAAGRAHVRAREEEAARWFREVATFLAENLEGAPGFGEVVAAVR